MKKRTGRIILWITAAVLLTAGAVLYIISPQFPLYTYELNVAGFVCAYIGVSIPVFMWSKRVGTDKIKAHEELMQQMKNEKMQLENENNNSDHDSGD